MNEKELSELPEPWPKNPDELITFVAQMTSRKHDYGTCTYAMSLAALAAFNYVAGQLGVTGFQASFADLDFLARRRGYKNGFIVTDGDHLLYPQYDVVGDLQRWIEKQRPALAKAARKLMEQRGEDGVHPDVWAHWKAMAGS